MIKEFNERQTVKVFFIFMLFLSSCIGTLCQNVVISGNAQSYAGKELVFMQYTDWITHSEEILDTCKVEPNGDFYLELPVTDTKLLFTYIGIYKAYFYAEPSRHYELVLPEYVEKSTEAVQVPSVKSV